MAVYLGIDACTYERPIESSELENKMFKSMIGCAVVTESLKEIKEAYFHGLKEGMKEIGFDCKRDVLSSFEILTITRGNMRVHERVLKETSPHISKLNIFYPIFNSKRIPKIKVYGKKKHIKEMLFDDFYNSHLLNSFPHICLWKIFSFVYGTKATVLIDHFQSELTNAWDDISKYPKIHCYVGGDMTNVLISLADIICKIVGHRLQEEDLFLRHDNLKKIFPEFKRDQFFSHWIGNPHLPRITMIHTNKVLLDKFIKRPVFYLLLGKESKIDKKVIINSSPKFMNFIHKKDGCVKFFSARDIYSMKDNDYLVCVNKKDKTEADNLKNLLQNQMNLKINSVNIIDVK